MFIIKPPQSYYQLESDRLYFASLSSKHISLWEAFFEDETPLRFLGFEGSKNDNSTKAEQWISKQIDRQKNGEFGQLAVYEKTDNSFVGVAGIIPREIEGRIEYEITFSLLSKCRNKGFATEAAKKLKAFLYEETLVDSAISIIHKENFASINVAQKNGMTLSHETTFMNMPVLIYRSKKN